MYPGGGGRGTWCGRRRSVRRCRFTHYSDDFYVFCTWDWFKNPALVVGKISSE